MSTYSIRIQTGDELVKTFRVDLPEKVEDLTTFQYLSIIDLDPENLLPTISKVADIPLSYLQQAPTADVESLLTMFSQYPSLELPSWDPDETEQTDVGAFAYHRLEYARSHMAESPVKVLPHIYLAYQWEKVSDDPFDPDRAERMLTKVMQMPCAKVLPPATFFLSALLRSSRLGTSGFGQYLLSKADRIMNHLPHTGLLSALTVSPEETSLNSKTS